MRRIAIINQKGGVGKTTTCVNLGAALAQRGQRVLLIDLDPQAHLTTHLGLDGAQGPGTYELLTENTALAEAVRPTESGMHLVASRMDLAAAESELISVVGREVILKNCLASVASDYDWLLIDCPPSFSVLTLNALVAADEIVVPLQAHFLGLQGVSRLLDTVRLVAERLNPALRVAGFVLCMHEAGTRLAGEVVADLGRFIAEARAQRLPWSAARIFETRIRRNIKLAECPSFGQSIFAYAGTSHGADDYRALSDEILGESAVAAPTVEKVPTTAKTATTAAAPATPFVAGPAIVKPAAAAARQQKRRLEEQSRKTERPAPRPRIETDSPASPRAVAQAVPAPAAADTSAEITPSTPDTARAVV